jgi:hypothetical protein
LREKKYSIEAKNGNNKNQSTSYSYANKSDKILFFDFISNITAYKNTNWSSDKKTG